jgi:hypothetical protein
MCVCVVVGWRLRTTCAVQKLVESTVPTQSPTHIKYAIFDEVGIKENSTELVMGDHRAMAPYIAKVPRSFTPALLLIYHLFTTADQELASTQTHGQADTLKHQAGDMELESDKTTSDQNGTRPQKSSVHIIYTHMYDILDAFALL